MDGIRVDNPNDIKNYDVKTMHRLETELYGKNAKSEKHIIIREIIEKKLISHSTLSVDEHKKQNQKQSARSLRTCSSTKNAKYGDSALEPLNVFSEANAVAGIKMRIDDKLKRIKNAGLVDATEDTLQDLAGYLILLMIAKDNASNDIQKRLRQDKPAPHPTTTSLGEDSEWEVEYSSI